MGVNRSGRAVRLSLLRGSVIALLGACSSQRQSPPGAGPSATATPTATAPSPKPWSLSVPTKPNVPDVMDAQWAKNPVDHFVLQKLEAAGLKPNAQAAAGRLLRRVTLDLTGLPPTVEELRAFEADSSDEAYDKVVDGLLARPAFGEQRARYWLDVARYADTHGFHFDNYRSAWPYRDYVIQSFASNKGFDVFTVEQLAGDLLPNPTVEQLTATGFIRAAMSTNEGGVDPEEYAAIYAKDRVDTMAGAWLGLTVGCAACHDHRYDPLTQKDFYGLAAFFRNTTQPIMDGNAEDAAPSIAVQPAMATTLVTGEASGDAFAFLLKRGRYDDLGERVPAGVPASLPPLAPGEPKNRLGLAHWLLAPEQPLTARVVVNRFWAELFGAGLVRTLNDFGRIGDSPSHPELLDWLSVQLRDSGWDVKHLFRLMVTSASYRQASDATADKLGADSDNRLLSRGPRFRMDAEMLRDFALATSGLLVDRVGGPSVKPYQPPNLWEPLSTPESNTAHYRQDSGESLYRRSLYTFWKREAPPPALETLNAPSREASVVQRERTNTPLQALVTMNDVQFVEAARVLATRALQQESSRDGRLEFMASRVLSRSLTRDEVTVFAELVAAQFANFTADAAAAGGLVHVGESSAPEALAPAELAAWTMVANTFLNLDEALTK